MGTRVSFYLGRRDGLASFVEEHLDAFERWAVSYAEKWPDEIGPVVAALRRVRTKSDPFQISSRTEATDLDFVTDTFFGDFCCFGGGNSLRSLASEGVFYVRHYAEAHASIESRAGDRAAELWSMILHGRGVGTNRQTYPYAPSDPVYRLAFWSREESRELLELLSSSFGPLVSKARAGAARRSARGAELAIETTVEALLEAQSRQVGLIVAVS